MTFQPRRTRRAFPGNTRFAAAFLTTLLTVLSGCDLLTGDRRTPTTITVSPSAVAFDAVGDTATLTAEVFDQDGAPMPDTPVEWSSSDPDVASTSVAGLVTSSGNGDGSIRASAGSASAESEISVLQIPAAFELAGGADQEGPAGEPLVDAVSIRVLDPQGHPAQGIRVEFEVEAGSGSVDPAEVSTGPTGIASTTWRLGTVAGEPQRLNARVVPVPIPETNPLLQEAALSVTVDAVAVPGAPSSIVKEGGDGQSVQRQSFLPIDPSIRVTDPYGNPVPDALVEWQVEVGGGSVDPVSTLTDAEGRTSSEWTLGTALGEQSLHASVEDLEPAVFTATSLAIPSVIQIVSGDPQSATVGEAVTDAPTVQVLDANGLPVPSTPVAFTVMAGGGSLDAPVATAAASDPPLAASSISSTTDLNGMASAGAWTLGTTAGENSLSASVQTPGVDPVLFHATGFAGPAALLEKVSGDGQTGTVGSTLRFPVRVRVRDAFGNPREGTTVSFQPDAGAGTATPSQTVTLSDGLASAQWTLGAGTGGQGLAVASPGLTPVVFVASATSGGGGGSPGAYDIELNYVTPVSPEVEQAFDAARARWSQIIVGDQQDVALTIPGADPSNPDDNPCRAPDEITRSFDDLYVLVRIEPIDGPGNVLGSAGPCYIRLSNNLTVVGAMRLDEADVAQMAANGTLEDVIVHELGHVIGIGTLWGPLGLLQDPATPSVPGVEDTHFTGPLATSAFDDVGGSGYADAKVPVENNESFGPGTYNGHWRESVFQHELMTGFISFGPNLLSRVTAASLADLGYVVDEGAADPYTLPGAAAVSGFGEEREAGIRIEEEIFGPIGTVGDDGSVNWIAPEGAP